MDNCSGFYGGCDRGQTPKLPGTIKLTEPHEKRAFLRKEQTRNSDGLLYCGYDVRLFSK